MNKYKNICQDLDNELKIAAEKIKLSQQYRQVEPPQIFEFVSNDTSFASQQPDKITSVHLTSQQMEQFD